MTQFDNAAYGLYNRWFAPPSIWDDNLLDKLKPENLYIGDKALIYVHPYGGPYNDDIFNNFWYVRKNIFSMYLSQSRTFGRLFTLRLTLETCKVCKDTDCASDSIEIITTACTDDSLLSTLMSTPLSTDETTNLYINEINSEWSYQLAEMTLFQFPNTPQSKSAISVVHFNSKFEW